MNIKVDRMHRNDWETVRSIYAQGIASGDATFETQVPDWEEWDTNHLPDPRLVAHSKDQVIGWAAVSPVSSRCIYSGVAEVSVYVAAQFRQRGVGKLLLQALITESEQAGIWTLQAGIFPENTRSLALHKSCGFREIGIREKISQDDGIWRDVILLERRSKVVGVQEPVS
ncbi:MAG: N-acetyltransferase family protein [Anaerolineales bacterium]